MNKLTIASLALAGILISCKNEKNTTEKESQETTVNVVEEVSETNHYPTELLTVFETHGGIGKWNEMQQLSYEMPEEDAKETHTVSLKDRRVKIDHNDWTIGFDGKDVWLLQNEPDTYKGNARFYHNLYFYFYAMPFVLGDDGITYEAVGPTQLGDATYEGIKISYEDGVGDSPKDEYILYYDPETHRMEWLGYTVTYRDNQKSDRWSFIKYEDWTNVEGLILPQTLVWYKTEDNKPTNEIRGEQKFENIQISKTALEDSLFQKPEAATVVER